MKAFLHHVSSQRYIGVVVAETFSFLNFSYTEKWLGYMVGRVLFRFGQLYLSKVFPHVLHYLFNVFV